MTFAMENTSVGEGKPAAKRTPARPSFSVCPVCGVPATGASYGIHDDCATVGFMKNLAGDLIDMALGRRPVVQPPVETPQSQKPSKPLRYAKIRTAAREEIKDAEFRVIDKEGHR